MSGKYLGKRFKIIVFVGFLLVLLAMISLIPLSESYAAADTRSSYIVFDADAFVPLVAENEHMELPMASTTKIMTALLAIENLPLEKIITIKKEMTGIEGSSVYLQEGENLSVRELLYCMMLRSGNDSAVALALSVADTIDDFAAVMNEKAKDLNLIHTHFINPHGLHDDRHYTSAYDLGFLASVAMKNRIFRDIVSTKKIAIGENEGKRTLINKNKILSLYEGANGIKTGYTKKSGRCLVSSATRDGRTLVCVVMNYGDTYGLSRRLLDEGFRRILCANA